MNNSLLFIKIFHTIDCIYKWVWRVLYLRCKLSTSKSPKLMPIVCPPISIPYDEFPPTQSSPVEGNQSEKSLIQNQAFSKEWSNHYSNSATGALKLPLTLWILLFVLTPTDSMQVCETQFSISIVTTVLFAIQILNIICL